MSGAGTVVVVPTIRLARPDDIVRLALTATRAFAGDPLMRWFFPDDADYLEINPQVTAYLCRRWLATDSLWCTDDGVALAGWAPPGRPDVDIERPALDHPEHRLSKFAALSHSLGANTPPEPHWYLNMLATHPDWQRQGLGAALMATVFDVADEMGLSCYLETATVENVAYYNRHGFDARSEWDLRTDTERGPHMWGMLRPAR